MLQWLATTGVVVMFSLWMGWRPDDGAVAWMARHPGVASVFIGIAAAVLVFVFGLDLKPDAISLGLDVLFGVLAGALAFRELRASRP
jgi:hypothetical protein